MKHLNRNHNSFDQFFLHCCLLNEDAVINSKSSSKSVTYAKSTILTSQSIKTDLLHKSQRKQIKVFQIQTNEESHGFMEICKLPQKKFGNLQKNQRYHTIHI